MNPAPRNTGGTGFRYPGDPAQTRLARQRQHIPGFPAGTTENFFGTGGNSLDARVIDANTTGSGTHLPPTTLTAHPAITDPATLLPARARPLPSPPIPAQDRDPTRPPLFQIHPGNGHTAPYCPLASALS